MVGNMKKCILIMISILVVLFSFIACTNNSSSNNSAAVTNKYGGIYTKIKSHQQVIRVTQQKSIRILQNLLLKSIIFQYSKPFF